MQTTGKSPTVYLLSDYSLVTASSTKGVCDQDGIINYELSKSQEQYMWHNGTKLKSCDILNLIVEVYHKLNDEPTGLQNTKLDTFTGAVGQAFGNVSFVLLLLGFLLAPILTTLFFNQFKQTKVY